MPKKILKRDVVQAHDAWANALSKFGSDNLDTVRKLGRYQDAVALWEDQNQRVFSLSGKPGPKFSEGGRPTYPSQTPPEPVPDAAPEPVPAKVPTATLDDMAPPAKKPSKPAAKKPAKKGGSPPRAQVKPQQGALPLDLPTPKNAPTAVPAAPSPSPARVQLPQAPSDFYAQLDQAYNGPNPYTRGLSELVDFQPPAPRPAPNVWEQYLNRPQLGAGAPSPGGLPVPRQLPQVPPPTVGPGIPMSSGELPQRTPILPQRTPSPYRVAPSTFPNEFGPEFIPEGSVTHGQNYLARFREGVNAPRPTGLPGPSGSGSNPLSGLPFDGSNNYRIGQASRATAGLSSDVYFDAAGSPRVVNSLGPVDDLPPIDPTRMTRPNTNVGLGDIPGLARGARYNLHPLTAARNTGLGTALSNTLSPDASIFKPGTRLGPTPGRTGFADFATRLGPKAEPNFGAGKWGSTIRGGMRNFTGGLVTSGSAQFGADIMANGGFGRSQADADASMNQQGARGDAYRAVQGGLGTAAFAGFGAGPAGLAALPGGALGTYGASQLNRHFGWGESDDITPMDVLSGDNMKREARGAFAGISDNALREARGEDVNGNQISGEQALQAKIEATIGERNKLQASYDASIKLPGTDAAINPAAASDAYAANMLEVTQRQLEDYRDRVKQRMSMTGESFETAAQATEMRDPEMIRRGFADPEGDILDDTGQPIGKNREYLDALGKMSPEEANPVEQEFYTLDKFRDVAGQAWIDPKYTDQLIAERREQIRVGALTVENSPRPVPMETGEMAVDPNTGQQVPEYMGRNGEFTTKASEALTWQEAAQQAGMPVGEFYAKENEMAAYQSLVADLPNLAEQSKAEAQKTFQRNALMAQLNQMIPQLLAPYDAMAANSAYFSDPNRAAAFQNLAGLRKNAFYAEQQMAPILAQLEAEQQREQAVANSRQAIADEYYNNLWAIEQGYRQPPQQSQANYDLSSLIPAG